MNSRNSINIELTNNIIEFTDYVNLNCYLYTLDGVCVEGVEISPTRSFFPFKVNSDGSITLCEIDEDGWGFRVMESLLQREYENYYGCTTKLERYEFIISTEQLTSLPINFLQGSLKDLLRIIDNARASQNIKTQSKNKGYEYVDMGLSVMWATCNVGAKSPEDFGEYYSWGEIQNKKDNSEYTYKFYYSDFDYENIYYHKYYPVRQFIGYNDLGRNERVVDTRTELEPMDDVAFMRMGEPWRMPTRYEFMELKNFCTWEWTSINNVHGYKITSNVKGFEDRSIFLPATGVSYHGTNTNANYWSSTLYEYEPIKAYSLYFQERVIWENEPYLRYSALSVRPVRKSDTWIGITEIQLQRLKKSIFPGSEYKICIESIKSNELDYSFFPVRYTSLDREIVKLERNSVVGIECGKAKVNVKCADTNVECVIEVKKYDSSKIDYVDLGLRVKWATCNLGALDCDDFGDYYAWGDISSKNIGHFGKESVAYRLFGEKNLFYKYCSDSKYGVYGYVDNKNRLDLIDDIVNSRLGGKWRTPTEEDFLELKKKCKWEWISLYGRYVYKITSKVKGYENKFIFLPGGEPIISYDSYCESDYEGSYWTSIVDNKKPYRAKRLSFDETHIVINSLDRYCGSLFRPVLPLNNYDKDEKLIISNELLHLNIGESYNIQIKGQRYFDSAPICWSSSKRDVVAVHSNGLIEAKAFGSSIVTAKSKGAIAKCKVIVEFNIQLYTYVDLGLSVKWATCNIGAIKPEDFGYYYAWGETTTKLNYSWETYKYCHNSHDTLNKYCNKKYYGNMKLCDDKIILDNIDDAAKLNCGDNWSIPSIEEFEELKDSCEWEWKVINGIGGYEGTSKIEGFTDKTIFFPSAGIRINDDIIAPTGNLYYWSNSIDKDCSYVAHASSIIKKHNTIIRAVGLPIRPVIRD